MQRIAEEKLLLVDGMTNKNTRGVKKSGVGLEERETSANERCTPHPHASKKKFTYVKRSSLLIKSLLQLFKQDINCFGLDLLPAFVDVHGFFEVRHVFLVWALRELECEKLKGWYWVALLKPAFSAYARHQHTNPLS